MEASVAASPGVRARLSAARPAANSRTARPGMAFEEFYRRFGGSFRTKHLSVIPTSLTGRLAWATRLVLGRRQTLVNERLYAPPAKSSLPGDFIRLDPWEAEYLFMMAARAERGIVEVGRFHGGSTFLLAAANQKVPIYSIDIQPQNDERLKGFLAEHSLGRNLELIVGDSQHGSYPHIHDIDMLFIDGDHSYQGCTNDLENHYPPVVRGGHVLLHDCYYGCEVQDSVLDFAASHRVSMVRSPHIIASHWQTSYGSIAHFTKDG